jgi:hypothetical protein
VCHHPNVVDIDAALLGVGDTGKLSQRQVCERWGLGRGQVSRHVNNGHIAAIMSAVAGEVTALHGQGLLTELASLYERANRLLAKAEHADDSKVAIAAIRECRGVIETFARIGLAMSQGEDPGGDEDRPDLDSKIDEALRRREKRLALAESTDDVVEAEVVEEIPFTP